LGIDLGTTHTAIARVTLDDADATTEPLAIEQRCGEGCEPLPLLPSFVYFPPAAEGPLALPWDAERTFAVGNHAQARASEVPDRVIGSAKSWLCHPTLDRRAGHLPLGAPEDIEKISAVEASWRYLEHVCEAYDARFADRDGPLAAQQVVLTVPASFDAAARDLTVEAALAAGIDGLTLLEEPQAALYAWLEAQREGWREALRPGDVVLVIDIGGGTTDFSAIEVRQRDGELELERVAVGEHILLGGDNIDLALAYHVKQRLEAGGKSVDAMELTALSHRCRRAKEKLLGVAAVDSVPVALPSRSSKLVGGTRRAELDRAAIEQLVLDGFFPAVDADARPAAPARGALRQMGLPYASDAAVTKHLAAFLGAHGTGDEPLAPTAILFNGGVMKSRVLRERLATVVSGWLERQGKREPRLLDATDLDRSVACGAAYFGRVRTGRGLRIRAGTARSYYVGIEGAAPAVPGIEPPLSLLCVAPFGMEEGSVVQLPPHELLAVVGEPVTFRFFSSTCRRDDVAGANFDLRSASAADVGELAPIEVTLPEGERQPGELVAVRLQSSVTGVGTLLLEAVPVDPKRRDEKWKVELSVRAS